MAISVQLKFTQGAVNPPAGEAAIGIANSLVTVEAVTVGAAVQSVKFDFLSVPFNSALPLGTFAAASPSNFLPDVTGGSWAVRVEVVGTDGTTASDIRVFSVPTRKRNWVIPAFDQGADAHNYDAQLRGWAGPAAPQLLDAILNDLDENSAIDWKDSVRAATTIALPANTRTGNVLTADGNGALPTIDGVTMAVDEDVLVLNEVNAVNNGAFVITDLGDGSNPWVMTRRSDFDTDFNVTSGATFPVSEGTTNAMSNFQLSTLDPVLINVTALTFVPFGELGVVTLQLAYDGGNSISVAGSPVSISNSTDTTDALTVTRSFGGSGEGILVDMQGTTTGTGILITSSSSGTAFEVDQSGSGAAMNVHGAGASSIVISGLGAVDIDSADTRDVTITSLGADVVLDAADGAEEGSGQILLRTIGVTRISVGQDGNIRVTAGNNQDFRTTPSGVGIGLDVVMGATTTGVGVHISSASGSTGTAFRVDQDGSGAAIDINGPGLSAFDITAAGAVTIVGDTNAQVTIRSNGAALLVIDSADAGVDLRTGNVDRIALSAAGTVSVLPGANSNFNATAQAGSGIGFNLTMPTGATGIGVHITCDAGSTGEALRVDQNGGGDAVDINGSGSSRLIIDSGGSASLIGESTVTIDSATNQVRLRQGGTDRFVVGSAGAVSVTPAANQSFNSTAVAGSGKGFNVSMPTGTTGFGTHITADSGATGTALQIDQDGSGAAINVNGAGISNFTLNAAGQIKMVGNTNQSIFFDSNGSGKVFLRGLGNGDVVCNAVGGDVELQTNTVLRLKCTQAGAVDVTPASGEDFSVTTAGAGIIDLVGITKLFNSTVAGVPTAANVGGMIFVTDETGGAVPAFSDGTNWRRVTDRAIVS